MKQMKIHTYFRNMYYKHIYEYMNHEGKTTNHNITQDQLVHVMHSNRAKKAEMTDRVLGSR